MLKSSFVAGVPTLVTTLFLLPVLAGLASVVFPALGYMPVLGFNQLSFLPWQELLATPRLGEMLLLSLSAGIVSTLISLILALGLVTTIWGRSLWHKAQRWLSPMMAVPHVALAFGLAFVLMPSGLLARFLAIPLGWDTPPGWHSVQDPYGFSFIFLLVLKETPFLIFMLMGAVGQLPIKQTMKIGYSLGYQRWIIWLKLIWPRLYPMIRLPVYTVLAFSISVVDVPLILGPSNPPMFSVQILQWMQDADLTLRLRAAAGSMLLLMLVAAIIGLFYLCEQLLAKLTRYWLINGYRGRFGAWAESFALISWRIVLVTFATSSAVLLVWSFVWRWRFPSLWPAWSLRSWQRALGQLSEPLWNSLYIGVIASLVAVIITIVLLEFSRKQTTYTKVVMYLPLLLPQMTFMFGIQVLLLLLNIEGHWLSVAAVHLIFVIPYCYLSLVGPWQGYDARHSIQAQLLSGSRIKAWWLVKLKLLWRPVLGSFALGFAVSIAQYLPTLFASAGRVPTVTTEAVSLVSGGNRRLIGVYGLVQMLLPMLCYLAAIGCSIWTLRKGRLVRRLNQ